MTTVNDRLWDLFVDSWPERPYKPSWASLSYTFEVRSVDSQRSDYAIPSPLFSIAACRFAA